jgi:hypothetical protein
MGIRHRSNRKKPLVLDIKFEIRDDICHICGENPTILKFLVTCYCNNCWFAYLDSR